MLGYEVTEQPFRFLPGALKAFPLLGAGLVWLALLQLPLLLSTTVPSVGAIIVWVTSALALGLLAWRIGSGLPMPGAEEREDANLIVRRPGAAVRRWIVAHIDTKAQGHSMAGRLVAAWLLVLAGSVHTVLALYRWLTNGPVNQNWVISAMLLSVVAGALAARGRLRGGSPGARDNGTGVLAALVTAEQNRDDAVGFIFTGAEEFGLVGARILARGDTVTAESSVINLDTLDQRGPFWVVHHDAAGAALAASFSGANFVPGQPHRIRRLPLGILTDSVAFSRRGIAAVTLARLDWTTLTLLHTANDSADGLETATAERVGTYLAQLPPA